MINIKTAALIAVITFGIGLALGRPWATSQAAPDGPYVLAASAVNTFHLTWRMNAQTGEVSFCIPPRGGDWMDGRPAYCSPWK